MKLKYYNLAVYFALSFAFVINLSAEQKVSSYERALEHIKNLPTPPEGYKWVVNPDFTDEFDGNTLDSSKWYDKSPYWKNGRPPATFKAENVSVGDGCLQIKSTKLAEPEGVDGKPGNIYSYAGGAVASKSDNAIYGYYETRMKASKLPMSSTFWMKNIPEKIEFIDENGDRHIINSRQELDIIETVGAPTKYADFDKHMNSNTHVSIVQQKPHKSVTYSKSNKGKKEILPPSSDDFHTYGCWWIDANTLNFYYDGKFMFTINPSTEFISHPFSRPMYMHLVTETYDWEPALPSDEVLADDTKNRAMYDWVRSYRLIPDREELVVPNVEKPTHKKLKSKIAK